MHVVYINDGVSSQRFMKRLKTFPSIQYVTVEMHQGEDEPEDDIGQVQEYPSVTSMGRLYEGFLACMKWLDTFECREDLAPADCFADGTQVLYSSPPSTSSEPLAAEEEDSSPFFPLGLIREMVDFSSTSLDS